MRKKGRREKQEIVARDIQQKENESRAAKNRKRGGNLKINKESGQKKRRSGKSKIGEQGEDKGRRKD